ncbi:hypothetical protein M569_07610, partial [Genlisea aurea]
MKLHHRFVACPAPPRRCRFSTAGVPFSVLPAKSPSARCVRAESLEFATLKLLEWPSVCRQLSVFTSTSMGASAAESGSIPLGRTPGESLRLLELTSAAMAIPLPLDFSEVKDISTVVDAAVSGEVLSIGHICAVIKTLRAVRTLNERLKEIISEFLHSHRCRALLEILESCSFPIELEQQIQHCIDCDLSVVLDRASDELEMIRSERKTNMENLESLLKRVSTQICSAGGISKPIITKRRSRMCVAVRSTHRYLVPGGVVLNSSSSGATYFMEPREAVDLNNLEVSLSDAEKIEEQIILTFLSGEIVKSSFQIKSFLDCVLEVDLAFARAGHARWIQGICPDIEFPGYQDRELNALIVDVTNVRHPLLLGCSLSKTNDLAASMYANSSGMKFGNVETGLDRGISNDLPVPVDFKIAHGVKVVVISGPNTGGKTASLKTLGLISIMLKAGMYLPASKLPRLPWFDVVAADIGDSQSLEQNLSTFSGHIAQLCGILKVATQKSLVLVDEIGSGTDPSEGLALSTSILEYLKHRVSLAVVTTHYAGLTRLKEKSAEFENAAMEFSPDSMQPTYRILWQSDGESNALAIAQKVGFDWKVIEGAKSWVKKLMPENMEKLNTLLYQSLAEERNTLQVQAERAADSLSEILQLYNKLANEADGINDREAALKAKQTEDLQHELQLVNTRIDGIVHDFEEQLKNSSPHHRARLLKEAESAIALVVEAHRPSVDARVDETVGNTYALRIGDQVLAESFGNKLVTVIEAPASDNTVLIQCGKIRARVNASSIKPAGRSSNSDASALRLRSQGQGMKRRRNMNSDGVISYSPRVQTSKNTLDLRGMRVEESRLQLDISIGSAPPNSIIFIIHGMGTGVLKEHVLEILRRHPRVAKFEHESPINNGCTVAYI